MRPKSTAAQSPASPPRHSVALPPLAPPLSRAERDARAKKPIGFEWTVEYGGKARRVFVRVPTAAQAAKAAEETNGAPMSVIFNFHGLTDGAKHHAHYTGMADVAAEHGFITIHPDGTRGMFAWPERIDRWGLAERLGPRGWEGLSAGPEVRAKGDVDFVRMLVARLPKLLRVLPEMKGSTCAIDADHLFLTGFSNGGYLSHYLARHMPEVAAIAPVGALSTGPMDALGRLLPALILHGNNDRIVQIDGKPFPILGAPALHTTVDELRRNNGLRKRSRIELGEGALRVQTWGTDPLRAVRVVTDDHAHAWLGTNPILLGRFTPPGFRTLNSVDATASIVAFFGAVRTALWQVSAQLGAKPFRSPI